MRSLAAGVRLGAVPTHRSWLLIVLCGCEYRGIQSHSPTFTEGCMTTARLSTIDFYTRQMVAGTSRLEIQREKHSSSREEKAAGSRACVGEEEAREGAGGSWRGGGEQVRGQSLQTGVELEADEIWL